MEIVDPVAQIVIAFAGIAGLMLAVMFFAFLLGNMISSIFPE